MVSVHVQNQIVVRPILREVFAGVVDHGVGAERSHRLQISRAADADHLGPERLRDLDGERPDPAGRAVDQDLVSPFNVSLVAQTLECGERRDRYGRGLFERALTGFSATRFWGTQRYSAKVPRVGLAAKTSSPG